MESNDKHRLLPTTPEGLRTQLRSMRMPSRAPHQRYMITDEYRAKIKTANIIRRLYAHFMDDVKTPLSVTQIASAKILLAKVLPDLTSTQLNQADSSPVRELTDAQLMRIVEGAQLEIEGEAVATPNVQPAPDLPGGE